MNTTLIMVGSSSLAIANSLFLGIYLIQPKNRSLANSLLAVLLAALAIRIFKSLVSVLIPETSQIIYAFGLGSIGAMGPLLYLYARSLSRNRSFEIKYHVFVPAVVMSIITFIGTQTQIYLFYLFIVFHLGIYTILSAIQLILESDEYTEAHLKWLKLLITMIFFIWTGMLFQIIYDNASSYAITSIVAATVIYFIAFWAMNNRKIFNPGTAGNPEAEKELKVISRKVHEFFLLSEIFKEKEITIQKVADRLRIQPYLISKSINKVDGISFPQLVNKYRLDNIKKCLKNSKDEQFSIKGLCYDNGFSSLSAFYTIFKKDTNLTPGEYRKRVNGLS